MTQKRIRARSAKSARRRADSKGVTVTKVNYIKGSRKHGMATYAITTKRKRK